MFFSYLCLYRCKRISLNGHERIEIRPTAKTQMILGTNGSGKSSLLEVGFSVTPSQRDDFLEGGYKTIKVEHRGHFYELTSRRNGKTMEHTFAMDDGENLNPGKTAAVQRELVREHFGVTQDLHDLLTGRSLFTAMSPQDRREWITRLSSTDFNYVLGLYGKVKKKAREANAVVKHNSNRLTVESGKLLKPGDIQSLEKRSKDVRAELNVLFQECQSSHVGTESFQESLRRELESLERDFKRVASTPLHPPEGFSWLSPGELDRDINNHEQEVQLLNGKLGTLGEEFQHYEHQMGKLKAIEGYDEAYIRKRLSEISAAIENHFSYITAGLPYYQVDIAHDAEDSLNEFMTLAHTVTERESLRYTDKFIAEARDRVYALQVKLNETSVKLGKIEGRLQHIDTCVETNCPKCGHVFKQGVTDNEAPKLQEHQQKGEQIRARLDAELKEAMVVQEDIEDYLNRVRYLQHFRQQHPSLVNFWGLVDRSGGLVCGGDLLPLCQLYRKDIHHARKIHELEEQERPLKEALATIEKVGGDGNTIRERYYQIKAKIEELSQVLRQRRETLSVLTKYQNQLLQQDRDVMALGERYGAFQRHLDQLIEEIRQDELRNVIRKHQGTLAIVETALTESEIQYGIVHDIEKDTEKVRLEEKAYRLLQDMLSPVDGLIAESISFFINVMIDRINAVIARVWGYNLALKPCNLEEGELDYKFPLYAVKEDNTIADIKNGSMSQVDIINQAFRLIVYKFMRLQHYPLYIDELERAFDPVHRHNLVPAIKDLIDDDTYSQVFIVSHYITTQASFQDSEVVVVEASHLDAHFNRTYNEHVAFG